MSTELFWLVLTIAMTGLLWVPYIVDRLMVRGPMGAMANPSPKDKPQSAWAHACWLRIPTRWKIWSFSLRSF